MAKKRLPSAMNEFDTSIFVSKELFEVHVSSLKDSISSLKIEIIKSLNKLEEQERTLLRNTITVEEHHKRSTQIENQQERVIATLNTITQKLYSLDFELKNLDSVIEPIVQHTKRVDSITKFFVLLYENKSLIFKIIVFILVMAVSTYVGLKHSMTILKLFN
jgi:chromosome segregation ATPase